MMATTPNPKTNRRAAAKAKPANGRPKGSWAQRNPQLVAAIPAEIAKGTHPRQFADAHGISLEIAWANFKKAGWVATGKGGGGKGITLTAAEARKAKAAQQALQALADAHQVSVASILKALQRQQEAGQTTS